MSSTNPLVGWLQATPKIGVRLLRHGAVAWVWLCSTFILGAVLTRYIAIQPPQTEQVEMVGVDRRGASIIHGIQVRYEGNVLTIPADKFFDVSMLTCDSLQLQVRPHLFGLRYWEGLERCER